MVDDIPQIKLKVEEVTSGSEDRGLKPTEEHVDVKANSSRISQIKLTDKADKFKALPKSAKVALSKLRLGLKRKKGDSSGKTGKQRKILGGFAVTSLVLAFLFLIVGFLSYRVYKNALVVKSSAESIVRAVDAQDLNKIKAELENTKGSLQRLNSSYKTVSWLRFLPFLGSYVSDGKHVLTAAEYGIEAAEIALETIEPYADIIGFSGKKEEEAGDGAKTTQERIDFVIKTIPDIIPRADEISEKVDKVKKEIEYIEPSRYPESFAGFQIRSKVEKGIELTDLAYQLVTNGKPLLEVAPHILGVEEARTYLVLFQNDKELRPTGGFMTAYAIANVEKGKFEPVASSDIYNLDSTYIPKADAPYPIVKYLKGPYLISDKLRLRDSNWSPDYYESMNFFVKEAESVGITGIDGVIAVDTQLLVNILDVLGPIGVSGYGNFSTEIIPECNCPQVIYELESFADIEGPIVWSENEPGKIVYAPPNYDNRKKIIGPLMNSVLANALGQPKDKLPALFAAAYKSLMEKHVLFYMLDEDSQKGVESFRIAGKIMDYDGDYLHINDANLGGRKSNLYVTQEVIQAIEVAKDGSVEKTVTITYKNPEKHDGWLNSVLPNWVRIYVPRGAELVTFEGVEDKTEPYEEFGKTVFAGFFELRPEGISKVTVRYKLPFKVTDNEYNLFIQKQPGTDAPLYQIMIGKQEEELFLRTDKEFKFKL